MTSPYFKCHSARSSITILMKSYKFKLFKLYVLDKNDVVYAKNHNVAKDSFLWHVASTILIGLQWSSKYYIGCLTPKFRIFSVHKYCTNILLFGEKVELLPKKGNFEQKYDCWRVLAEPGTFSQARPLPIRPNITFCFRMFNILVTNTKEVIRLWRCRPLDNVRILGVKAF